MLLPAVLTPTSLAQEACAPTKPLAIGVDEGGFVAPKVADPIGNRRQGNVRSTSLSVTKKVICTPIVEAKEGAQAFFAQRAKRWLCGAKLLGKVPFFALTQAGSSNSRLMPLFWASKKSDKTIKKSNGLDSKQTL
jgi:hypothetical protein